MEDNAARPEPSVAPSPAELDAQKRLEELEREAAQLRLQISGQADMPDASHVEPQSAAEEGPASSESHAISVQPLTREQIAKAEGFIRQARLARQRGQAAQVSIYLRDAEKAAPNAPVVLEFIGDDYVERKMYKEARETYRKAKDIDPKNVAVERKFAEMVLRTGAGANASFASEYEVMASGKIATLLSTILPGLGQIVSGEVSKGLTIMVIWLGMLAWIGPSGLTGLLTVIGIKKGNPETFHPIILVPLFIAFVLWIGAIFDAKMGTGMMAPKKIDRPKPPDDLPFE